MKKAAFLGRNYNTQLYAEDVCSIGYNFIPYLYELDLYNNKTLFPLSFFLV